MSLRALTRALSQQRRPILARPAEHLSRRRSLRLAPPFLLDDYTPRYQLLTSVQESKKRSLAHAHLRKCNLCPRKCDIDRTTTRGHCLIGSDAVVSTIAPHFGEEPCIQGHNGSGAVFFSGCNLRCVFCQNHDIAHTNAGFSVTPEELGEWFVKLQDVGGVHNINLVTPEHVVPQVALSILHAKELGLKVPIVYNTSSYDSRESLELMDGLVDVYLADFKVWEESTGRRLLKDNGDYAKTAREAVQEMQRQVGDLCFTGDGIAKKGLLVRHLVMPGKEEEGKEIVRWLASEVSRDTCVHVMEQYHPRAHVGKEKRGRRRAEASNDVNEESQLRYADINRPVQMEEVGSVMEAARQAGLWRFIEVAEHGGFNL